VKESKMIGIKSKKKFLQGPKLEFVNITRTRSGINPFFIMVLNRYLTTSIETL